MHRRPSSRIGVDNIILPTKLYEEVVKVSLQHDLEVREVISRFFLLGFISFDRPLYILEDGVYKQILYEDPRP